MGKNDIIVKNWLSDTKRAADLFNAEVFDGNQVVKPEDLKIVPGEEKHLIKDKNEKEKPVTRYRDIMLHWKYGIDFWILAIENQNKVHYGMPVRNMIYDGLMYKEQMDNLWKAHMKKKENVTKEEFLSRMMKKDKLKPVITLVFYFGDEPWDINKDLHEMLDMDEDREMYSKIKKYIPNYHINLVDVARISNAEDYKSDLHHVIKMIQCKKDKDKMKHYIHNNPEYFSALDEESYEMLKVVLNSKKLFEKMDKMEVEGERNMCQAIDDLWNEAEEHGMGLGIEKGIGIGMERGIERTLHELIMKNHAVGMQEESIAEFLGKSVDYVRSVIMSGEQKVEDELLCS